jgi:hypothetical protein
MSSQDIRLNVILLSQHEQSILYNNYISIEDSSFSSCWFLEAIPILEREKMVISLIAAPTFYELDVSILSGFQGFFHVCSLQLYTIVHFKWENQRFLLVVVCITGLQNYRLLNLVILKFFKYFYGHQRKHESLLICP